MTRSARKFAHNAGFILRGCGLDPTIRAITCPYCKNILFALELETKGGGAQWHITKDSPAVQDDAEGRYMSCGRCAKRVAVEKVSAPGVETWKITAAQR